jgi:hypothetical protein
MLPCVTSNPEGAAPVPSRDPYKIADVLVPWTAYEYEDDYANELEWPGAEYDARTVAKGKSAEARNRVRQGPLARDLYGRRQHRDGLIFA